MATKIAKSKKIQYWGTGRRKKSIARVRVLPNGNGSITINGRDIDTYFNLDTLKYIVRQPLALTDSLTKYDVAVNVKGGGFTGQAGAIRHGISRALVLAGEDKDKIKKAGFLTRDPRMKERKKIRSAQGEKGSSVLQEIIFVFNSDRLRLSGGGFCLRYVNFFFRCEISCLTAQKFLFSK